jgi:hypothetical protein
MMLLLAACGGGDSTSTPASTAGGSGASPTPVEAGSNSGSSNGSNGGGSGATSTATTVTFDSATLSVQGATGSIISDSSVHFVIKNAPVGSFYTQTARQGAAIFATSTSLPNRGEGNITVKFWTPNQLGAGTYTDSIRVRLCIDDACAQPIAGAEATLPVTYTVIGAAGPQSSFNVMPGSTTRFWAHSGDATAPLAKLKLTVSDLPPTGLYVRFTEQPPAGDPKLVVSAELEQTSAGTTPNASADLDIRLAVPTSLSARTYTEDLQVFLCFDSACTRKVQGGPVAFKLTYQIYATEGREFVSRVLDLNARSAAWDAMGRKLYVLQVKQSGTFLVAVDPVTGATGTPVTVPGESTSIVISDNGQFAYINSTYDPAVYRYRLPAMTLDATIALGGFLRADQIAVAPGAPTTLAVSRSSSAVAEKLVIYDGIVARASTVPGGGSIAWGTNSSVLYAAGEDSLTLNTYAVAANGLSLVAADKLTQGTGLGSQLAYAGGLLYTDRGGVIDPAAHTLVGRLEDLCCDKLTPDAALDRAFAFGGNSLTSYVLSTRKELSTALFENLSPRDTAPIRWGSNGLALVDYDGKLVLLSGNLVAP